MSCRRRCSIVLVCLLSYSLPVYAQSPAVEPVIVRADETVSDIVVRGRPLHVLGQVNGSLLVLGNDATIEGRVHGDATVIGGSITQRNGGYIGGDVIVVGGDYIQTPEARPLNPQAQKIVIREYGDYLRDAFQRPWRRLFLPQLSALYVVQRILGLLFYFLIALLLIAIMPTQLNRAIHVLKHRAVNIGVVGLLSAMLFVVGLFLLVRTLPIEVAASLTLFASLVLLGVYFFGSLAMHLLVGRWVQQRFRHGRDRSTINALLYGMGTFAIIFSLPIIGMLTTLGLAIVSFGLVTTLPFNSLHRAGPAQSTVGTAS